MKAERIILYLTFLGLFLLRPSKIQSAQAEGKGFYPPDILDMYSSHKGQPIASIGLSQSELRYVLSVVRRNDMVVEGRLQSTTALEKELLARRVDMGEGANNGLVVLGANGLCGGTGNCISCFFRRSHGKWQLVLDGPLAGAFAFIPPKHTGLLNLLLITHLGGGEAPTDIWKFNGTRYELAKSYCTRDDGLAVEGKCP